MIQPEQKVTVLQPKRRAGVVIGANWTPEHCVVRNGPIYWERTWPAEQMSADELRVQLALLRK